MSGSTVGDAGRASMTDDPLAALSAEARSRLRPGDVPSWIEPMLATLVDRPFSDPDWLYERKLDGVRVLALRQGGELRLRTRRQRAVEHTYPELLDPLLAMAPDRYVLDGEVVAFDGDATSFARLQRRMGIDDRRKALASGIAIRYYAFDLLRLDGHDTTGLALRDRKALLRRALAFEDPIRFTPHRNEHGIEAYEEACRSGWEGVIAKDATAPYSSGRSRRWQKLKCVRRQELVIGGYTDPGGARTGFGAILVGHHDGGELVYAGKVGTGFDVDTLTELGAAMQRLERADSPFGRGEPPTDGVHWIEPRLVAEIEFAEWTAAGRLRHPRYLGLRADKAASEVVREVPS